MKTSPNKVKAKYIVSLWAGSTFNPSLLNVTLIGGERCKIDIGEIVRLCQQSRVVFEATQTSRQRYRRLSVPERALCKPKSTKTKF